MKGFETAVIVPIYNEEKNIDRTLEKVINFVKIYPNFSFIFVNDGSTDKTLEILKERIDKAETSALKIVSYKKNKGKGYAVRTGVLYADSEKILFIDGDLAYSLDHLLDLSYNLNNHDIVIGSRPFNRDNTSKIKLARKIAGKTFNLLSKYILGLDYVDMQAGIKGFRKDIAKKIFSIQRIEGFAFDAEILYLGKKYGAKIGEIPVNVSKDHLKKESKVNLLSDSLKMFLSLINIRTNDLGGKYG